MNDTRLCQQCGGPIIGRRSDAKYCTGKCREKHTNDKWGPLKRLERMLLSSPRKGGPILAGRARQTATLRSVTTHYAYRGKRR
jgi:hypothetical protein